MGVASPSNSFLQCEVIKIAEFLLFFTLNVAYDSLLRC